MIGALRGMARLAAIATVALIGLPVALLVPAALLDQGPSGGVRASLFPMALTLWDPFVWTCARNSLIVAAIVAGVSLVIGVALARVVGPWRFWGRPPLAALAWLPLAMPPAVAAVGLSHLLPPGRVGRWLASSGTTPLETPGGVWIAWGLLVWAEVASATVLVALSVKAALGRIDPAWADMGRALGASPGRAWRQLVWPIVRPEVARTSAAVFAIALLDPGAPLVLGQRRTLSYLIVETVVRGDAPTRAAALALIGLALALVGRALIRWWGGPRIDVDPHGVARPARASWFRASLSILGLAAWIAFGMAPLAGLVGIAIGASSSKADEGWVVSLATVVYRLIDADTARIWRNSLFLGLATTAVAGLVVLGLARSPSTSRRDRRDRPSLWLLAFERTPALVFGVALGSVPGLLAMARDGLSIPALGRLASWLDPVRWPGLLLIAAAAAVRLPTLARAADRAEARSRPALVDAAASLGASRRCAVRLGGGRGPGKGALALTFALAATAAAPALVLAPSMRTRPVGAAIVMLAEDRPRAAALGLGAVALNLLGLAAARRGRPGPAGDWLRG
jgi:iron(III) transport system permease protein